MTKDEAKEKIINDFCKCRVWCELYPDLCQTESCEIWWALKALSDRPKDKWIPIKWHYITDEEREESDYPKDWVYLLDCEMPEDGQEIIVTTKHGYVEKDVCYLDDGYSLDSGWDWIDDIAAWIEMPPVYQEEDNKMNVYELIESSHSMDELDDIRGVVMDIINSCESIEEMKRIQDAFKRQKNKIRYGKYRRSRR